MSFSKLVQPLYAEMLAFMGDIYADFERKRDSSITIATQQ